MRVWLVSLLFLPLACTSKPARAPAPFELRQSFYSLKQSNFSGYKCQVHSPMIKNLSDFEMEMFFKDSFKREPTVQEKTLIRRLKWTVLNSNQKQDVSPSPAVKEFPTSESQDFVERATSLLIIINKVMTLTYLETFADRQDISRIDIGDRFFQIYNSETDIIADLNFNYHKYKIFFGAPENQIEVTMRKLGSMQIPESMELKSSTSNKGKFYPHFEIVGGFPQLKRIDVVLPQVGQIRAPLDFDDCEYFRAD